MLLTPSPCHKLSHLLGPPPPSSVTYFIDGPIGLHRLHTSQLDLLLTLYTRVVNSSDILVLKIILVLVFIQFWVNNFYFSFSFSFKIILVSISVSVLK